MAITATMPPTTKPTNLPEFPKEQQVKKQKYYQQPQHLMATANKPRTRDRTSTAKKPKQQKKSNKNKKAKAVATDSEKIATTTATANKSATTSTSKPEEKDNDKVLPEVSPDERKVPLLFLRPGT